MTLYTTPLQLGYFFSLLMAVLFWLRSYRQERLSDRFLGWVMFFIAIQLQDYTFGFAGINILWDELNGFPRDVDLLFGPALYFYFKSQTNRAFRLKSQDLIHLLPWAVYFVICITVFLKGQEAVFRFNESFIGYSLDFCYNIIRLISLSFYLWSSLKVYLRYRIWSETQFSDTEIISFRWFRNFLYFMIGWIVCRESINLIDGFLDLNFYQDWWWNLPLVVTALYVGLEGYAQQQPREILFPVVDEKQQNTENAKAKTKDSPTINWDQKIDQQHIYLQSNLSLKELAKILGLPARELSNYINQQFEINFNDYINRKRVRAFEQKIKENAHREYTLISIAYDCGFNSKATFLRAFKKQNGCTPKEFVALHDSNF